MPLTDEEKNKIVEEERYRAQVKSGVSSEKKGPGCFTILLIIFVGIPLLATFLFTVINPAKFINDSKQTSIPTPTQIQTPTSQTEEKTQIQQVVNVKELIGKRYADLDSILGTPELEYKPEPPATGLIAWEKGDVNIETNYYNLQDSVQAISFSFKEGVSFKDHNDAFKTVGLDAINSQPDKTTTFQKKWYNIQGMYLVSFTTGINGRQAILVLFYCNPDRLGVCELLK